MVLGGVLLEYFISFITFFAIYFCVNILVEPIRKKYLIKKIPDKTIVNNKNNKNSKNNKNNVKQSNQTPDKENTRKEIIGIIKNSLIVSFIYIFVIFILKRFS